jgi:hypothetical protein
MTEWYIKEMLGVDNTEVCYLHCTRFWLMHSSGESVQYKWLQNGSQKGTIQTELDYQMVRQGMSRKWRHRELVQRNLQGWQGFLTDALLGWRVSSIKGCRMGARKTLSKLSLTTGWWVKGCREMMAQGTCAEELAGMARMFVWCTTQVESVQYKRLQNGSQPERHYPNWNLTTRWCIKGCWEMTAHWVLMECGHAPRHHTVKWNRNENDESQERRANEDYYQGNCNWA